MCQGNGIALSGSGRDGLEFYRLLSREAPARMLSGGILAVEIGASQTEAVSALFLGAGLGDVAVSRDLAGRDRVVTAVKA